MEKIDFTSLENAIKSLDEIIERYNRESYDDAIRDALIQRFECTYSLTLKFLNRFLKILLPEVEDNLSFNDIIRKANQYNLLQTNLEQWTLYRQKRNFASRIYNATFVNSVVEVAYKFKNEVHFILNSFKSLIEKDLIKL